MTPKTKKGFEQKPLEQRLKEWLDENAGLYDEEEWIRRLAWKFIYPEMLSASRKVVVKSFKRGFKQGFEQGKGWQMADELERKIKEA